MVYENNASNQDLTAVADTLLSNVLSINWRNALTSIISLVLNLYNTHTVISSTTVHEDLSYNSLGQ